MMGAGGNLLGQALSSQVSNQANGSLAQLA